jgi:uncharacterized protein (TIGR02246 family)
MQRKTTRFTIGALAGAALALMLAGGLGASRAASGDATQARLQRLEDREQIQELLIAYGATLDRHDFAAFGQLFADDAEYAGGPGAPTKGRAAIQAQLERTIMSNPSHLPPPNHHIFFNQSIRVEGDRATAHSLGAYVAPDAAGKSTQMVFFVAYDDVLIRHDGKWQFLRRALGSGTP